jgi:hypothetical protein
MQCQWCGCKRGARVETQLLSVLSRDACVGVACSALTMVGTTVRHNPLNGDGGPHVNLNQDEHQPIRVVSGLSGIAAVGLQAWSEC